MYGMIWVHKPELLGERKHHNLPLESVKDGELFHGKKRERGRIKERF